MVITDTIKRFILGLWTRSRKNAWEEDLKVFAKKHVDPYNFEGLELVLLHLDRNVIFEPNVALRRELRVFTTAPTVDLMLSLLAQARLHVLGGDTMPKDFYPSEDSRFRRFDDYFVSASGHTVSIEKVLPSLEGWTVQLISTLRDLETDDLLKYDHYNRKLRPLYRDLYYVLTAILESSFR